MFDAIFDILNDADSLDLLIQSYQLLVELDKVLEFLFLNFHLCRSLFLHLGNFFCRVMLCL